MADEMALKKEDKRTRIMKHVARNGTHMQLYATAE
jgi:hypothetical protein